MSYYKISRIESDQIPTHKTRSQKHNNLSLEEAEIIVNTIFKSLFETLHHGKRIEARGCGIFKVRNYRFYTGGDLKKGKSIEVK
jgi:nucleoid DNA-binding protein